MELARVGYITLFVSLLLWWGFYGGDCSNFSDV